MRRLPGLFVAAWVSLLATMALAQHGGYDAAPEGEPGERGIGYPTVADALEDLRARPDVQLSIQDGWTIVNDPVSQTLWSFTPPGHPAHPTAVKRTIIERDGNIDMDMRALCQAAKADCDALMREFEALNAAFRESLGDGPEQRQGQWAPSEQQKSDAVATMERYLRAVDESRYKDAYDSLTSGMRSIMTFMEFAAVEQDFRSSAGGPSMRSNVRVTWYNDPPQAAAPGVYAAFDITCQYTAFKWCAEVLILHQQDDGRFLVMRHERTFERR